MVAIINTALLRAMTAVKARLAEERGQDLLEYSLLGGLIALAIIAVGALGVMTGAISGMAGGIADCIDFNAATSCAPF